MKQELRALASLAGPFPSFQIDAVPDDPHVLFAAWLRQAIDAGLREPHAMVVSSIGQDGAPDARVLILKNVDQRGWHFATTAHGPKGSQIAENPGVALTFYWSSLGRQVRIRGVARRAESAECAADFRARSLDARANVLIGRQSQPLTSRQELDDALATQMDRLHQQPDMTAENWSLFIVSGREIEFWQGAEDRRHGRMSYALHQGRWRHTLLWP